MYLAITSQGIPRPLGIFMRPPHPEPKNSSNPKLKLRKFPSHLGYSEMERKV